MLCFLCTRNYKRKLRALETKKRERTESDAHNGSAKKRAPEPISVAASHAGSNLEPNWKAMYEDKDAQAQKRASEFHARYCAPSLYSSSSPLSYCRINQ